MLADILVAAGRVLIGGVFVFGGVHHFLTMPALEQLIAARGLPAPRLVLVGGSIFQLVAGLLLMLGLYVDWAAFGLIGFTVAASVMLLNFWDKAGPERASLQNAFLQNIGLVGGLLIAAVSG